MLTHDGIGKEHDSFSAACKKYHRGCFWKFWNRDDNTDTLDKRRATGSMLTVSNTHVQKHAIVCLLFFNTQTTDFTRHYSNSTKDPKYVQF